MIRAHVRVQRLVHLLHIRVHVLLVVRMERALVWQRPRMRLLVQGTSTWHDMHTVCVVHLLGRLVQGRRVSLPCIVCGIHVLASIRMQQVVCFHTKVMNHRCYIFMHRCHLATHKKLVLRVVIEGERFGRATEQRRVDQIKDTQTHDPAGQTAS